MKLFKSKSQKGNIIQLGYIKAMSKSEAVTIAKKECEQNNYKLIRLVEIKSFNL